MGAEPVMDAGEEGFLEETAGALGRRKGTAESAKGTSLVEPRATRGWNSLLKPGLL